jgi:hypothetical protein
MRSNVKAAIDEIKGKIEGGRPPRENNGSGDSKPSKSKFLKRIVNKAISCVL